MDGVLRRTASGLTVVGFRLSLLPLKDVEYGPIVDAESITKLGTPLTKVVHLLAVEFHFLFKIS